MIEIQIDTEYIRLDALMKLSGLASMGGEAKHFIQDGLVRLNGAICTERSKKIRPGDVIEFSRQQVKVV